MRRKGNIAEQSAIEYLQKQNYQIIETNFYSRFGEIDIIAINNNTIHFVEVKSGEFFDPLRNITPAKMKKIIQTINFYIFKNNLDLDYCISAIIVKNKKIEFLENISF